MEHLVPITFCAGLFTWLVAGNHYQTQEKLHLAAIEHGLVRVPATQPNDGGLAAPVLVGFGVGFAIASYVSLSLSPSADLAPPLAVSVWGLIASLIGLALWQRRRRPADAPVPRAAEAA